MISTGWQICTDNEYFSPYTEGATEIWWQRFRSEQFISLEKKGLKININGFKYKQQFDAEHEIRNKGRNITMR